MHKKLSKLFPAALSCLSVAFALSACTARDEQLVKELENMPGVTCVEGADDQPHCGPDSLKATQSPNS